MISPGFDFDKFVANVQDLSIEEINVRLREEIRETGRLTGPHVRGAPKRRKPAAPQYLNLLKGLVYALSGNQRPSSVEPWNLPRMRPIFESLIGRAQLRPEALTLFDISSK